MAISIARKTLLHEWRRFLPASIAIAFSGVLMTAQGALLLGIVSANALYVTQSNAAYWVGFPGTQSVDLGRTVKADAVTDLYAEANISHVEPFLLGSGDWRGGRGGGVSVTIVGVDTAADGTALVKVLPPEMRNRLTEPGTAAIDRADSSKLSARLNDVVEVNGKAVHVIGFIDGLRGLGGVNLVTSLETARALDSALPAAGSATYFLYDLKPGTNAADILQDLGNRSGIPRYEVWPADELANISTMYMLLDSGAGIAFVFATLISMLIGAVITSQTLMAAVAGTIPQYATLRALGVPFHSLRRIVIEQAGWVGISGLSLSLVISLLLAGAAAFYRVPFELRGSVIAGASLVVLLVALVACLLAVHRLREADPATLLR
ncbi:FtsX-like permease family protein [Rhizobium wuzhouense]|uniref:ABC transporter permease n=1 Tax=Rhizobium wuzhouense TaxID=1986026 RepID=A0ABX5NSA5_9HYPH|nr:FtsX-like permease family protein [Rhizobium wuzhouense]PYB74211.1 ABC transporter permease [Rhizobium wuzhouense]